MIRSPQQRSSPRRQLSPVITAVSLEYSILQSTVRCKDCRTLRKEKSFSSRRLANNTANLSENKNAANLQSTHSKPSTAIRHLVSGLIYSLSELSHG
ncbi:hypothetical protein DTO271D3_2605 [Paecilomyces variotii]|nr:hypothetical protein DTO271D3_2605 [Paecilomyces variotii]